MAAETPGRSRRHVRHLLPRRGTWDVDNNVWIVGDDREVIVIDAPHDADAIAAAVGDRHVLAIVCTHGHDDHIDAAPALADRYRCADLAQPGRSAPVGHEVARPQARRRDPAASSTAGGSPHCESLVDAGHSPGLDLPLRARTRHGFTGDTLFQGGPGATGRSFSSSSTTIIDSIRERRCSRCPPDTTVRTGHGDPTNMAPKPRTWEEWIKQGG